ncbi:PQQ-dependent sugar dehydrogenase [Shewanella avicenniae]|uniref:PQQ-dependent sugar dehydrogenase n=2 Tax=Shewanella avicenniae TaxID=2814294 RepID=A0ABX7QSD1_9GAMM|nr:PQQ-dependent sugar dehydrogenase [Shewanella avicenniae]
MKNLCNRTGSRVGAGLLLLGTSFICMTAAAAQSVIITVTKGFSVSLYATDLGDAKQIAVGDDGTLFVGSHKSGTITALVDSNSDGRVDRRYLVAKDLEYPEALAFHDGNLYVAENERIVVFNNIEQRLRRPVRPVEIYDRLPDNSKKSVRGMKFGPDGRLYVAIGAPCNVCEPTSPYGSIIAIDTKFGEARQIATGIRQVVGMDWSPEDNKLWFADSSRDWMGDNIPPDEIDRVESLGEHFGFPYIHGKSVKEPAYDKPKNLKVTPPVFELPAHVAPKGILFYRGDQFPEDYHNQLLVAENGSWNRSSKVGYQIVLLKLDGNKVLERNTVVSFLDGEFPMARPYSMAMAPDGSVYISDDLKGNVYRLFYKGSGPSDE